MSRHNHPGSVTSEEAGNGTIRAVWGEQRGGTGTTPMNNAYDSVGYPASFQAFLPPENSYTLV